MSNRSKRLGMVVASFIVLCAVVWNLLSARSESASWRSESQSWADSSIETPPALPASATYSGEELSPAPYATAASASTPSADAGGCAATSSPAPVVVEQCGGESYAVAADRLHGLPPDAAPGSRFTLWVSWGPRISKTPRIQKLIPVVALERMIPPVIDGGPTTAMLGIPRRYLSDMLYADRFGDLAVTLHRQG